MHCTFLLTFTGSDQPGESNDPQDLHHPDLTAGAAHFRLPVNEGLSIMRSLRGHISGMCLPYYMIDLPGGGGKIPLIPEYVKETENNTLKGENFQGEIFEYPDG